MRYLVLLTLGILVTGCGPSVSVTRMQELPSRPSGCELEFVKEDINAIHQGGEWTIIGYVGLSETGMADPYSEKYREIVRPRACEMGGSAVSLGMASTQQSGIRSGSSTVYSVLAPSSEVEATGPETF